jgi:peroxiredoxin
MDETARLKAGDVAPDLVAPDTNGTEHQLAQITRERPCVVIFYRGHW